MKRFLFINLMCMAFVALAAIAMTACNVTRTVTTSSSYIQKGDTTVTIQTKTIEQYDASKR